MDRNCFPIQNCYCLLTRKKLLCFSDDTRTRLISCLNFKKVDCRVKTKDDSGMSFDLVYGEEEIGHTFKTDSIEKTELWISDIHYIIKSFINEPKLKIRKGSQ